MKRLPNWVRMFWNRPRQSAQARRPGQFAPTDFDGVTRGVPPDIGAYENTTGP